MKKNLAWAVVALLALVVAWRLSWPRFLPVERSHGDPPYRGSFAETANRAELIVLADIKSVKQGPDFVSRINESTVYRAPTQRITLEVAKVYKGDVAQGQIVTLYQGGVGVTWSYQLALPVFRIKEEDPVYERGERYVLMLGPVPMPEEIKPYQPEPWQEGMFAVVYPEGRMRLNADGTVTSALNTFGTNGKTLAEIEAMTISYPTTYNGVILPLPARGGVDPSVTLPPAWLIMGSEAVQGSYGSYAMTVKAGDTYMTEGGDAAPPPLNPDLATAIVPADKQVVIVIGTGSIKEFHATIRRWTNDPVLYNSTEGELKAKAEPHGNLTAFTVEHTGDAGDLLLLVSITFPVEPGYYLDNSVSYLWRLNPTK